MPSGLDGNPDPLVTPTRSSVLARVASTVAGRRKTGAPLFVAIDGIDGSGKSTFGDELAARLQAPGCRVVRATIDSFHNPSAVRKKRGAASPVGFYLDSHNLVAVQDQLLRPLRSGDEYVSAVFDAPSDTPVDATPMPGSEVDVLIFDGIFALRPELAAYWDYTIFLDGQERVNLKRLGYVLGELPSEPIDVVAHVLDWDRKIDRYSSGMQYYLDLVDPLRVADMVIDNNDLASPVIKRP